MATTYFEGGDAITFPTDDDAYDYASINRTCLTDDDGREVYCKRWDH